MPINNQLKQSAVIWGIAATAFSIFICVFNNAAMVVYASLFAKILAVVAASVAGTAGALIGDALRRAVHPDMVITNGGFFSLLGTKLFWAVGPQVIGLVVCALVAMVLVLR